MIAWPDLCSALSSVARSLLIPMIRTALLPVLLAFVCSLGSLAAQVTLKRGAVVYTGSSANTSSPAHFDESRAKQATKEWQRIQNEGIDLDSALGKQLVQQMNNKIREAAKAVAQDESRDLVVRKDDITDAQGKDVMDLTDKVVGKLGQ